MLIDVVASTSDHCRVKLTNASERDNFHCKIRVKMLNHTYAEFGIWRRHSSQHISFHANSKIFQKNLYMYTFIRITLIEQFQLKGTTNYHHAGVFKHFINRCYLILFLIFKASCDIIHVTHHLPNYTENSKRNAQVQINFQHQITMYDICIKCPLIDKDLADIRHCDICVV